jgi:PD-(D/E)XK nuclease superfamily protein
VADAPSREELEALHCWDSEDAVPGRPEMTAFRRRLRLHQARWREAHGHPLGSQPIVPRAGKPSRLVGSRLPLEYARETGANFVNAAAREAAQARTSFVEPHQSLDHQRLWADLLWSPTLCFNLFGDLAADLALADHAVHTWWPDTPGTVTAVRFAHSPGRLDAVYLGNLIAFDVAFVLDLGDGTQGILGVATTYHERAKRALPKPARLPRYLEVSRRSGVFGPDAIEAVNGTDLLTTWLGHLLVHSMLQQPGGTWRWGRYVVVPPSGNGDIAGVCDRYRSVLADASTFAAPSLEELLAAPGALPRATVRALRERYLTS